MGVKITVGTEFGLDIRNLDFSNLWNADDIVEKSTLFRLHYSDGFVDEFRGSGFTYDKQGVPTGGTASSYSALVDGKTVFTISNASIAVKDMVKVSLTGSREDDVKLITAELSGADTFIGGGKQDVIFTGAGNDSLKGNGGNDLLLAGSGNDKLEGGRGQDYLSGEAGNDTFIFRSVKDSTVSTSGQDTILDFTSSDRIDLRDIDANTKSSGNQDFKFIGTKAFDGHSGQLRYEKHDSDTYIYGDINGDKKADFAIHLEHAITLKSGYFIL